MADDSGIESAEAKVKIIEQLKRREDRRKKQPPYKTMVTDLPEAVLEELRGWQPPRNTAYVLFQSRQFEIGSEEWRDSLMTFNVEGRPEQTDKLEYYLKKGFRIIDYGNFPRLDHPNSQRVRVAKNHLDKNGRNPWDSLAEACRYHMGLEEKKEAKVKGLEAKLAEAEAKLALKEKPIKVVNPNAPPQ